MISPFAAVTLLSVLTVFGQALSLVLIVCLLLEHATKQPSALATWIARHGLLLMLIVAAVSTAGSLFFSDIAGWTPCKLCWYQRIFMYPQVPLLALAWWKRDRGIARSILLLSLFGLVIATGHYKEQVLAALHPAAEALKPCDATGVSCAKTPIFEFGYITIPLMAFTAFLLNITGSWAMLRRK